MRRLRKSTLLPVPGRMFAGCPKIVIIAVVVLDLGAFVAVGRSEAAGDDDKSSQSSQTAPQSASRQRIGSLVERLGDDDYRVREDAQEQLARLGFDAFDALSEAENNEDPEVAGRARYLLRLLQVDFADNNDSDHVQAILRRYQSHSADEKIQQMRALASLPKGEGLPALCRLVRFERSELLSKHAAAAILQWQMENRGSIDQSAALITQILASSRRGGASWLRESLRFSAEPEAALKQWAQFIRMENDLLGSGDGRTDASVVLTLICHEFQCMFVLGRSNVEKSASFGRLVSQRRKDAEAINTLVPWLIEAEAWKPLKQQPLEFAERFAANPRKSLYALAEAFAEQGQPQQAEKAAKRAFRLDSDGATRQEAARLETAFLLQKRGRFAWARREYKHCLQSGGDVEIVLLAGSYLAEMLHDQRDELRAAETLQTLIEYLKKQKSENLSAAKAIELLEIDQKSMEARRGFFLAEHYKSQGDRDKQRECLENALAVDPSEVDVLIACYRLEDSTPEFRDKVKKHIRETVDRARLMALKKPSLSTHYNQLAWLVANTEGDLDEALQFSRKSLQLYENCGGYYDTLARCCFAKGELLKAVEYQTRAAELEPHSGLIARQLEQFKKTLAEKSKNGGDSPPQGRK